MKKLTITLLMLVTGIVSSMAMAANPKVKIETSHGDIVLLLDAQAAPESVANFVLYVEDGFYNGTVFHRVIKDFMIQGGGFEQGMKKKDTRSPIKNEANNGLKNVRGSIAMARTNNPHSATAQFFINTVDNDTAHKGRKSLDYKSERNWGYAVFGKVISGMETVDKIRSVQTGTAGMFRDVPVQPVTINKASLIEASK